MLEHLFVKLLVVLWDIFVFCFYAILIIAVGRLLVVIVLAMFASGKPAEEESPPILQVRVVKSPEKDRIDLVPRKRPGKKDPAKLPKPSPSTSLLGEAQMRAFWEKRFKDEE